MPLFDGIARDLVTKHRIGTAAVSQQPRSFGVPSSSTQEARVTVTFTTVNSSVPVYHGLRRVPSRYTVVSMNKAARIYNDSSFHADFRTLVVKCDTANVVAELVVS